MKAVDYSVYLVTDAPERYARGLWANLEEAISGGVSVVQFRATRGSKRELFETGTRLRDLLRGRGVPLIVNDHVDLALALDADGVHVGQQDLPARVVRRLLGPNKIIGLSLTDEHQLDAAAAAEVDYLGVGPVFATQSKSDAAPALGLERLAAVVRRSSLPVVAIGGIDVARAPSVFATGVAGVAVIASLSQAAEPAAAARQLRRAKSDVS